MIVIVGASLAGATAAFELRRAGVSDPITVVGDELHLPYERPELSKGALAGSMDLAEFTIRADDYASANITLRLGRKAIAVNTDDRTVTFDDGSALSYSSLVIATGVSNAIPPIPGIEQPHVHSLRTWDDALAIRSRLIPGARVALIGFGFIGAEVASTAHALGCSVTAIDLQDAPLDAHLGPQLSQRIMEMHRAAGLATRFGTSVRSIGTDAVETTDGELIPADLVVIGAGVRANTDWLLNSDIQLDNRFVVVDERNRTSHEDHYAIGDVTTAAYGHWQAAVTHARNLALTITGGETVAYSPYFWSVQYDAYIQIAGSLNGDPVEHESEGMLMSIESNGAVVGVAAIDDRRGFNRLRKQIAPR